MQAAQGFDRGYDAGTNKPQILAKTPLYVVLIGSFHSRHSTRDKTTNVLRVSFPADDRDLGICAPDQLNDDLVLDDAEQSIEK